MSTRVRKLSFETLEARAFLAADLQGAALSAIDTIGMGSALTVQARVRNAGDAATGGFQVQFYLSQDGVGSSDDFHLLRTNGSTYFGHGGLAANTLGPAFSVILQLPPALPAGFTGENFYVVMKVDAANQVVESNGSNNFGQLGNGIDREPITISPPDIAVSFNGRNIADNNVITATADGTDFGSVNFGTVPISRTFTVRNAGAGTLTLSPVSLPTGYTLTEGLVTSLAAGASDTFSVRLDTATAGTKTGQISIATNDPNENPFDFTIKGTVGAAPPEISVFFGSQPLTDNDSSPASSDGTDFGAMPIGGTPISRTFTVRNEGGSTLTLSAVTLPANFALTEGLAPSLAPGASDTFTVQLYGATLGIKQGILRIYNNDPNESPFDFALKGSVVPALPEISVLFGSQNVADNDITPIAGDGTDFGAVAQGGTATRTFTVRNDGFAPLTLGSVVLPSGFRITNSLVSSLAIGASDDFTVEIDTATLGTKSGQISFTTNDANENPFNFAIRGNVIPGSPEISVLHGAQNITDGNTSASTIEGTDFGTVTLGDAPITRTFTVSNTGIDPLLLGAVSVPTGFTVTEGLASVIAPGASDTFTVEFTVTSVGTFSGEITFATNDSNESPFNFAIRGVVIPPTADVLGASLVAPLTALQWGDVLTINAQLRNAGTGPSGPFAVQWYLSEDATGSTADDILLSRTGGAGDSFTHTDIAAGGVGPTLSVDLQLPLSLPSGWSGTNFFLLMRSDAADQIIELDETNNFGQVGDGIDRESLQIVNDNTFTLHSLPGATKRIYLDFDGHTTTDPSWNGGVTIVTPRFDSDNDLTSFSANELDQIKESWRRTAEYYMPFGVDVTTEDPGLAAIIDSGGGDDEWGIRVVIGGDGAWRGSAGVAILFSFGSSRDLNCFVFSDVWDDDPVGVAGTAAHEVGHTLGLSHDGRTTPSEAYYAGHGSGETRWQPVMGSGPLLGLEHWSKGEYASADNTEDDLAIITTGNGFSYRPDDHGNSSTAATPLLFASVTSLVGSGIIEQTTDLDYFAFTVTATGVVDIDVSPSNIGRMLDAEVRLYDSSSTLISTDNPANLVAASINRTLSVGTYYLQVDGVGKGDPLVDGYTDYGSIGYYSIVVTASGGATLTAPKTQAPPASLAEKLSFGARASKTFGGAADEAPTVTSKLLAAVWPVLDIEVPASHSPFSEQDNGNEATSVASRTVSFSPRATFLNTADALLVNPASPPIALELAKCNHVDAIYKSADAVLSAWEEVDLLAF